MKTLGALLYGSSVSILVLALFHVQVSFLLWVLPMVAAILGFLLATLGIILCVLVRPSRAKTRQAAGPLVAVAITVLLVPHTACPAWKMYLWARRERLEAFVHGVHSDVDIRGWRAAVRERRIQNGPHVIDWDACISEAGLEMLAQSRYRELQMLMRKDGVISFEMTPSYIALVTDGFLDNLCGLVWVSPGAEPPAIGSHFCNADLVDLMDLGDSWYAFGTT